jgi:hypothetical protein
MSPISVILYLIRTKLFIVQSTLRFSIFELICEGRNSFFFYSAQQDNCNDGLHRHKHLLASTGFYYKSDQFVYFQFPSETDI